MNRPIPPRPSTPAEVDDREWLAQERALSGLAGGRRDALLAQALRALPAAMPPPGFAAEMARLVESGATLVTDVAEPRLERVLLGLLLALMALAAVGAAAVWGSEWWALSGQALAGRTVGRHVGPWLLIVAVCLLLSWLPEGARRLHGTTRAPTAA